MLRKGSRFIQTQTPWLSQSNPTQHPAPLPANYLDVDVIPTREVADQQVGNLEGLDLQGARMIGHAGSGKYQPNGSSWTQHCRQKHVSTDRLHLI